MILPGPQTGEGTATDSTPRVQEFPQIPPSFLPCSLFSAPAARFAAKNRGDSHRDGVRGVFHALCGKTEELQLDLSHASPAPCLPSFSLSQTELVASPFNRSALSLQLALPRGSFRGQVHQVTERCGVFLISVDADTSDRTGSSCQDLYYLKE